MSGRGALALMEAGRAGTLEVAELACDACPARTFSAAFVAERREDVPCMRPECPGRMRLVAMAF